MNQTVVTNDNSQEDAGTSLEHGKCGPAGQCCCVIVSNFEFYSSKSFPNVTVASYFESCRAISYKVYLTVVQFLSRLTDIWGERLSRGFVHVCHDSGDRS